MARNDLVPSDQRLLDVAVAVADGLIVDWTSSGTSPRDELTLDALRTIGTIADAFSPSRDSTDTELTFSEPASRALLPHGERWGTLEIRKHVGSGRFGDVYRAWDPALARDVALKLLPAQASAKEGDDSVLVREGQMMARVRHPNVVTVFGAQRLRGQAGLWMEFIHCRTLHDEFREGGPFTAVELIRVGSQLSSALAAVHAAGLVHRDVKAQNVMRADDGRIVLGDFGIGQERSDAASRRIAGSPAYLAPEIFKGGPASPQSDIYSLGALLFYLASGSYPFSGRSWQDVRDAQTRGERTRLAALRPDLPAELIAIIERSLETGVEHRFASAAEMALALGSTIEHPPGIPIPATARVRTNRFRASAVVAAGLLSAVAVTTVLWSRSESASAVPVLNQGDAVLVTAFDNRTGDTLLNEVLSYALSHDLRASPLVKVASPLRVRDALNAHDVAPDPTMTLALARSVAQRDGRIRLIADGSVEKEQSGYLLRLTLFEPGTTAPLWRGENRVPNHAALLAAIRDRAFELRELFGEPRAALDRERRPLRPAFSPSPAALRGYLEARREIDADIYMMDSTRRPLNERIAATEGPLRASLRDDPEFAPALVMLAWALREGKQAPEEYRPLAGLGRKLAMRVGSNQHLADGIELDLSVVRPGGAAVLSTASMTTLGRAARQYEAALLLDPQNRFIELLLAGASRPSRYDVHVGAVRAAAADARPLHYVANTAAAWTLFREGNFTAARRYAARAQAIGVVPVKAPSGSIVPFVSPRLLGAYAAFMEGKPLVAAKEADQVASSLVDVSRLERASLEDQLADLYLTIGQLKNARKLATTLTQRAAVTSASLDTAEAARAITEVAGVRQLEQFGRGWLLINAHSLAEADRQLQALPSVLKQAPLAWTSMFLEGMLARARGRVDEAVSLLEAASAEMNRTGEIAIPDIEPAYGFVDEALAAVLIERGDWERADLVIQSALKMKAQPLGGNTFMPPRLGASLSLRALQLRIRLHRQPNSDGGAALGLRPLLVAADSNHPVRLLVDEMVGAAMKRASERTRLSPVPPSSTR